MRHSGLQSRAVSVRALDNSSMLSFARLAKAAGLGLMLATAAAAYPAHAQGLFGGKVDLQDSGEDSLRPPGQSPRPACATDAENDELSRLRDSWQSIYEANRQAIADEAKAAAEDLEKWKADYNKGIELSAAGELLKEAQKLLANARARNSPQVPVYFKEFEAALAKATALRTAREKTASEVRLARAALNERRTLLKGTGVLLLKAKNNYETLEKKLGDKKSCPPQATPRPQPTPLPGSVAERWDGFNFGAFTSVTGGQVNLTERFAATGFQTNAFSDSSARGGGGFTVGYNAVVQQRYLFGIVFNVSVPDSEVRHPFPPTPFFIASTQNVSVDILGRAGILATPNLLLYGQGGITIANNRLQIDFGGAPTDENRTSVAAAAGGGFEFKLPWMAPNNNLFKSPSVFVDYLHTFRSNTQLDRPAASPFFLYDFDRTSDQLKVGIRFKINSGYDTPPWDPNSRL